MGKNLTKLQADFLKKLRNENKLKNKIPSGYKKGSSGMRSPFGYTPYIKGSLFNPEKYGIYNVVYVKDKEMKSESPKKIYKVTPSKIKRKK